MKQGVILAVLLYSKDDLDPAIEIEVLSPPATLFDSLNENSIVLKVTYNKVSFLLMGDAGIEAENSLLSSGYDLKSTVLKVGHHGSSSSSGSAFLSMVKPSSSVIEVGTGNDYVHPTSKTLGALAEYRLEDLPDLLQRPAAEEPHGVQQIEDCRP